MPLIEQNIATLNIPENSSVTLKGEVLDWDESELPVEAREVDVLMLVSKQKMESTLIQ